MLCYIEWWIFRQFDGILLNAEKIREIDSLISNYKTISRNIFRASNACNDVNIRIPVFPSERTKAIFGIYLCTL